MSSYSMTVSGPSPQLAMLRALAQKTLHHLQAAWATVKITVTRVSRVAHAVTTTALAVIGSNAGYQLVRHSTAAAISGTSRLLAAGVRLFHRGVQAVGRLALAGIDVISPVAADVVAEAFDVWVAQPAAELVRKVGSWLHDLGQLVWHLSNTELVRAVTVRAAQVASIILGVHTLTKGAVAAKLVQALPWTMDAVLFVTNPGWAALLVAGAFLGSLLFAAFRVFDGPDNDPEEDSPDKAEPALRPTAMAVQAVPDPAVDLREVAAQLNVEVAVDGSVLVHGVPNDLPDDVGLQVAQVAAKAATERLERILLHRPVLSRDDRRLLTKVAREAVRVQRRLLAVS